MTADVLVIGPRSRPESVGIFNKHRGMGMRQTIHEYDDKTRQTRSLKPSEMKYRPTTADITQGTRKNAQGEILGADSHPEDLSTVPRVKDEAAHIHKKNQGTLSGIYATYNENVFGKGAAREGRGIYTDNRPKSAQKWEQEYSNNRPAKNETMKGPIATDPSYKKHPPQSAGPPRVKSEANETYKNGINGSLGKILAESYDAARRKNMQMAQRRAGQQVKCQNFRNKNIRRVGQIENHSKMRRDQLNDNQEKNHFNRISNDPHNLWRSTKYKNVSSRVKKMYIQRPNEYDQNDLNAPREVATQITTEEVNSQTGADGAFTIIVERPNTAGARIPTAGVSNNQPKNFVAINARKQTQLGKARHEKIQDHSTAKNYNRQTDLQNRRPQTAAGQIPKYLRDMNKERYEKEMEARRKNKRNLLGLTPPPGHRALENMERLEMLKTLNSTQKELTKKLAGCPESSRTLRAKNYKEGLLRKLAEVDEAIRVFSKPVVFVKERN